MCLAVPAKIIGITDGVADCQVGEGPTCIKASLMLLEEPAELGDYLIIHAGFALRVMDPKEAQESLTILRDMVRATGGEPPEGMPF